jgi:hypothetical protein
MGGRNSLRAELDEQRCLIEKQQVQIDRLTRQVETQSLQAADMQSHLDWLLRLPAPASNPEWQSRGNGHGRHAQPQANSDQAISSDA